jgi:2-polyprenyl-6-methoxyphenol hydroxylase-like FAD-dependent oxidoreductase
MGDRFISLLRGDLAAMLYHSLGGDVETLFGTEVRRLLEHDGGIDVELAGGEMRRFDLVIGADGLHSGVRHLMLGTHRAHEYDLGYRVAAFTAREYPYRNELVYVTRTVPGRQVARCALRDGRTVFFMIMGSELIAKYDVSSVAHQKRALRDVFAHIGTEQSAVRQALDSCDDLYFDSVSQARVPQWSRGRIALVGDAAYGPSLLAGEGTSLAMAGAYVLAGELATAGDASIAFSNYERRLKSHMDRKQRQATRMGSWFAPRTQPGLWIRNSVTALASVAPFSKLLLRGFDDGDLPMPQQLPAACAPP